MLNFQGLKLYDQEEIATSIKIDTFMAPEMTSEKLSRRPSFAKTEPRIPTKHIMAL